MKRIHATGGSPTVLVQLETKTTARSHDSRRSGMSRKDAARR
jgi:hypothetical protein